MPLMRGAVALAMLTATACVFHHQHVTCDIADAACGLNESCVLADKGVTCSCGATTSNSAVCTNGTVCSPDAGACVINNPPTAVISSERSDGTLRIPASGAVTLSGAGSSDPDGGPLTFAWSFSTACGVSASVDLTQATVTFDSSTITDGCVVTLTVTDNLGASSTAQATLVPRLVGGYVSQISPCVAAYMSTSEAPQGTVANPFCFPDQAVLAAADNALGEVSLAGEVFDMVATLVVGTTPIVGGYTVNRSAPWTIGVNPTRLSNAGGVSNANVVLMATAGASRLSNLVVGHDADCTAACNLIEITGTQATLDKVTVTTGELSAVASVNAVLNSVWVHADATTAPTALTIMNGSVIEGMAASVSYAVHISGPVATLIKDSAIHGGGATGLSAGVRTSNVTSFSAANTQISVTGPGGSLATAIGYLDGTNRQIYDACPTNDTGSCDGSNNVKLSNVTATVSNYAAGVGFAAAKTDEIEMISVTANVQGKVAVGMRTLDCGQITVGNPTFTVLALPGANPQARYAAGYYDGYSNGSTTFANGSARIALEGGTIMAKVEPDPTLAVNQVSAALFYDTQSATVQGTDFIATGDSGAKGRTALASAVTTWKVANFVFDHVTMNVAGIIATTGITAFSDGRIPGGALGPAASTNVGFSGGSFVVDFSDQSDGVERAVMQFAGTTTSTVDSAQVQLVHGVTGSAYAFNQAGVWTLGTAGMTLKNIALSVVPSAMVATPGSGTTWIYGFLDGPPEGIGTDDDTSLTAAASHNLVIDRNNVQIGVISAVNLVGILVRGQLPLASPGIFDAYRFITNNFVDVSSDTLDFGIIADRAQAAIYMNTIRYGDCPSTGCAGAGSGIYLQQTGAVPASIIGNVITEGQRSLQDNSPAVIDLEANSATVGFSAFDWNARGGSGTTPPTVSEWKVAYNSDRTHFVVIPTDLGPMDDLTLHAKGVDVSNNADGFITFCDAYHVATGPVSLAIPSDASFVDTTLVSKDIDQTSRNAPYDAGANVRATCP